MGVHRSKDTITIMLSILGLATILTFGYISTKGAIILYNIPKICAIIDNPDTFNLYMRGYSLCCYSDLQVEHFIEDCGTDECTMDEFKDVIRFADVNTLYFRNFEPQKLNYLMYEFNTRSLLILYGWNITGVNNELVVKRIYEQMHEIEVRDDLIWLIIVNNLDIVLSDLAIERFKSLDEDDIIDIIQNTKNDEMIDIGLKTLGLSISPIEFKTLKS